RGPNSRTLNSPIIDVGERHTLLHPPGMSLLAGLAVLFRLLFQLVLQLLRRDEPLEARHLCVLAAEQPVCAAHPRLTSCDQLDQPTLEENAQAIARFSEAHTAPPRGVSPAEEGLRQGVLLDRAEQCQGPLAQRRKRPPQDW